MLWRETSDSDRSNGPAGHLRAPEGFRQPSDCQVLQAGGGEEEREEVWATRLTAHGAWMREVPGSADLDTDSITVDRLQIKLTSLVVDRDIIEFFVSQLYNLFAFLFSSL